MPENNKEEVIVKNLTDELKEKETLALVSLMRKGRMRDEELMKSLGLNTLNAAAYYRKRLEDRNIISGYIAKINWGKLGYKTEFFVVCEGDDTESLADIEKDYILSTAEYMERVGDFIIIPTGLGNVLISDIINCFGEKSIVLIHGYATSEQDAVVYSKGYVRKSYPGLKTTLVTVKYAHVLNFFIQKEVINVMKNTITMTKRDKEAMDEFKKTFPWDKLGVKQ